MFSASLRLLATRARFHFLWCRWTGLLGARECFDERLNATRWRGGIKRRENGETAQRWCAGKASYESRRRSVVWDTNAGLVSSPSETGKASPMRGRVAEMMTGVRFSFGVGKRHFDGRLILIPRSYAIFGANSGVSYVRRGVVHFPSPLKHRLWSLVARQPAARPKVSRAVPGS